MGMVRMVGARKGGRRVFFSDSGTAWPGAGSPHRGWGSQLALTFWARDPRPCSLFPRVPIPPSFPSFWRARARAGSPRPHFLSARSAEAGRSPTQKRRRDRYLPAWEWREPAPAVCACAPGSCGCTAVGRVSVSLSFGGFFVVF